VRIGFIGNANNYPFMIARAFRRLGHDVLFVLIHDKTIPLDRPASRYNDALHHPSWIYDASPLNLWNHAIDNPQRQKVVKLLQTCELVVLNQYAVCLAPEIQRPSITLLTGTDLLTLARREYVDEIMKVSCTSDPLTWDYISARAFYKKNVSAQRFGIKNSLIVNFFEKGVIPAGDALLDEIGVNDKQRTSYMITDTEAITFTPLPKNKTIKISCATRLTWDRSKPPLYTDLDYKGSDIMIKGLSKFYKLHKLPMDIQLFKKGEHVKETMDLVGEEGLTSMVTWNEEISQSELLELLRGSDIIIEQLDTSMIGMTGLDAMAVGRPVIGNSHPENTGEFSPFHPVCNAKTPDEVCHQLVRLVLNPSEGEKIAEASRAYVEEYHSTDYVAEKLLAKIKSYSNKLAFDTGSLNDLINTQLEDLQLEFKRSYTRLQDNYSRLQDDYTRLQDNYNKITSIPFIKILIKINQYSLPLIKKILTKFYKIKSFLGF
jgi:glycosyltransferase involved in cell wall biosynthesis